MNTTYFDEMTANCIAWENAKKERDERLEQIFQTYGWKSPEMEAWKAEDQAAVRPYSNGAMKVYFVFKQHCASESTEVEIDSYCWDSEYHDFVETLRKLGIRRPLLQRKAAAKFASCNTEYIRRGLQMQVFSFCRVHSPLLQHPT